MDKKSHGQYLKMITSYCGRCENLNSGKNGPCPLCVYKSKRILPLPPISFKEKKR